MRISNTKIIIMLFSAFFNFLETILTLFTIFSLWLQPYIARKRANGIKTSIGKRAGTNCMLNNTSGSYMNNDVSIVILESSILYTNSKTYKLSKICIALTSHTCLASWNKQTKYKTIQLNVTVVYFALSCSWI